MRIQIDYFTAPLKRVINGVFESPHEAAIERALGK